MKLSERKLRHFWDGNAICIVEDDFVNLAESPAKFHVRGTLTERYITQFKSSLAEAQKKAINWQGQLTICEEDKSRYAEELENLVADLAGRDLMDAEASSFLSGQELVPEGTLDELAQTIIERDAFILMYQMSVRPVDVPHEEVAKTHRIVNEFLKKQADEKR